MITGTGGDLVLVWGNCQAAPLADLLSAPLAEHGLTVQPLPPVYLAGAEDVARLHQLLPRCAVLVSQPIRDEYEQPGCGTDQLAALMPPTARVVRVPIVYDVGAFPFQIRGYAGDGRRIDCPVTDYHDLRMVLAASRGWSAARTIAQWPAVPDDAVRAVAAASVAELRRRETGQDVLASDLVGAPDALWTMTHPANSLLAEVASRILRVLGLEEAVPSPEREYLGARRAPVDPATARALGWAGHQGRSDWLVDGRPRPLADLVVEQLAFYAERPDVVAETLRHNTGRLELLGLGEPEPGGPGRSRR